MTQSSEITAAGRYIILVAAFLGWMFSGFQMAVMTLTARSATTEFVRRGVVTAAEPMRLARLTAAPHFPDGPQLPVEGGQAALQQGVPRWVSWYNAGVLVGAASRSEEHKAETP